MSREEKLLNLLPKEFQGDIAAAVGVTRDTKCSFKNLRKVFRNRKSSEQIETWYGQRVSTEYLGGIR